MPVSTTSLVELEATMTTIEIESNKGWNKLWLKYDSMVVV